MIVPVLGHSQKLQAMLDSIDFPIDHIIIIVNGGKINTLSCNQANELSIIKFPYNSGISIAYNTGIKLTPMSKYWLLAQDDIIWNPGGLMKINDLSGSDNLCIAMNTNRPFACRTMGENVVAKVGLLDESFFPAPGDDFNYHKRCHYHNINEVDITGTFQAEMSSTIKEMVLSGDISISTWNNNFYRSLFGPPINNGWSLSRRRTQGIPGDANDPAIKDLMSGLSAQYKIHNDFENIAFNMGIETL
jgi:glycosyltransferase involved in cell wall biosynthesis